MLVTNAGRIIRSPVNDIRIASRNTQGVTLFSVDKGEKVVSVTVTSAVEDEENENPEDETEVISNLEDISITKEIKDEE
jgi:DNA gyrase subunit A